MKQWLGSLRVAQWIKNGFVIAPIFFSLRYMQAEAWVLTLTAALAFCFASSFVYIINDIRDREEDSYHPVKANRPIASRAMSVPVALALALGCLLVSGGALHYLPQYCSVVILGYILLNILYTLWLKHHALLDVFFIAGCFVLRVLMGCYALNVTVSPWIVTTTFMLALFIGFGKRYSELGIEGYADKKQNLQHYSRELLDKLIIICAASALVCYAIYTTEMARQQHSHGLVYTVGFVAFGLFRYLQVIYVYGKGGEPEQVILRDKWQWVNILAWLATTLWIIAPHSR